MMEEYRRFNILSNASSNASLGRDTGISDGSLVSKLQQQVKRACVEKVTLCRLMFFYMTGTLPGVF